MTTARRDDDTSPATDPDSAPRDIARWVVFLLALGLVILALFVVAAFIWGPNYN